MKIVRFLRRLKNRIKYIFQFKIMYKWDYESCEKCGCCFKIAYSLKDEIWNKIYGSENGCLCLNCLLELAIKKNIFLNKKDFIWLSLFYGNNGNNDIIKENR